MTRISSLFSAGRPAPVVWVLLTLAAVAVGVGGYLHGHLFWEGYSHVDVVGPLFLLNAIGSGVVIALLALGRPALFAIGALAISLGSIISILISHSSSFFGFAEQGYDTRATVIVIAQCVASGLVLLAVVIARSSLVDQSSAQSPA